MAHSEPDDDRDEPAFRAPLPLDDRLWRHPSELTIEADAPRQPTWPRRWRPAVFRNR